MSNKKLILIVVSSVWINTVFANPELSYQVVEQPITIDSPRIGINLGDWVSWGASQLMVNVLKNPGFEGIIDRAIVIVKNSTALSFSDDMNWTKRSDGFWSGAQFDIRTGLKAGTQGTLFNSSSAGKDGLPEFSVTGRAPQLQSDDVVSLTRIDDTDLPSQWWFSKDLLPGQLSVITSEKRPGSPGVRTLAIKPKSEKPVEIFSYLDAIGDRAGKLLPVNGEWKLRFWMRQTESNAKLTIRFQRNGSQPFFQETFQPTSEWQIYERSFKAHDVGASGTLQLSLLGEGTNGLILLDDIELGAAPTKADANPIFRSELITALKRLNPGYLRDWQGQLGDTFENRIAPTFARRPTRYRPDENSTFSYSLPDFFQLVRNVDAQPWIIIPPTFNDQELQNLGAYLTEQIKKYDFKEMLVEFGNENWNQTFRPAGIPDYSMHGAAATRAFKYLLIGAKNHPAIKTIVNGQYVNPWLSLKILDSVENANALAIAPYFLFTLNKTDNILSTLFKQDDFFKEAFTGTQSRDKELMIYEVNLHTTSGDAPATMRDIATTSSAAGAALAKRLLTAINLGVKRQCVYTLAQYDAFIESNQGQQDLVKLWGVVRDLGGTQLLRPTGLAMSMINEVLPADIHDLKSLDQATDKDITLTAFHNQNGWGLTAVSAKPDKQKINVHFPNQKPKQLWRILRLDSSSPEANNEKDENVRIKEEQITSQTDTFEVIIPPYGLIVALPVKTL